MNYEEFKQKVYSYLIDYKKNTLKINEKGVSAHDVAHDCLFPKSYWEKKIPPMIYPEIVETLKDIQDNKFAYKPHIQASKHVASSQTACLNLFIPVLESEHADEILLASGIAPKNFGKIDRSQLRKGYCFEYWESEHRGDKGLLGDHSPHAGTDSDVAIAYLDKDDNKKLCLWLIEHKLTEREFTTCGGYKSVGNSEKENCDKCSKQDILKNYNLCYYHRKCNYYYWDITDRHSEFFNGEYKGEGCPFKKGMNQLWRNQMLALELEKEGIFDEVYFSVVTHPENKFLDETMAEYKRLTKNNPKFYDFKSTILVDKAEKYLPGWVKWYKKVYLGLD